MRKSCFNCKHLYSAGQNMFICGRHASSGKMRLQNSLDNICNLHECKSEKEKTNTKTIFYR